MAACRLQSRPDTVPCLRLRGPHSPTPRDGVLVCLGDGGVVAAANDSGLLVDARRVSKRDACGQQRTG